MKILLSLFIVFCLTACAEKIDNNLLLGEWDLAEWTDVKTDQPINGTMNFAFKSDKRYEVDYGSEKEIGKYWIAGTYLHTHEDGRAEKKVLITTLTNDSLAFEMNRAGKIEKVVLLKK